MQIGRLLLAATMLASVSTVSVAQGRGGGMARRGDSTMTEQQRQSLRELRARHQREITELRARHREQLERAMPPAARQQLQERRRELMREGRMFERRQMMRRPPGELQRGPGRRFEMRRPMRQMGQMRQMGPMGPMGPRGRGGFARPDSGGGPGERGRGGR